MSVFVLLFFGGLAHAAVTADVSVFAGARGNAESTVEHEEHSDFGQLEPLAVAALVGEVRLSTPVGIWCGSSGEAWFYGPDASPSVLRATPTIGGAFDLSPRLHLDVGARYGWETLPFLEGRQDGRAEGVVRGGYDAGAHRIGVVGQAVDRRWFSEAAWSFRTVEGGLEWSVQPNAFRAGAHATFQWNQAAVEHHDALQSATGNQFRVAILGGWTGQNVDVSAEYRFYLAIEGDGEHADRPEFTPIGDYDDDADALSAGGFVQHRLQFSVGAQPARHWTLDADVVARLRSSAPEEENDRGEEVSGALHARVDLGRELSGPWSVHLVTGVTTLTAHRDVITLDPSGWLLLRWTPTPP